MNCCLKAGYVDLAGPDTAGELIGKGDESVTRSPQATRAEGQPEVLTERATPAGRHQRHARGIAGNPRVAIARRRCLTDGPGPSGSAGPRNSTTVDRSWALMT